jgi:hypothetical protein
VDTLQAALREIDKRESPIHHICPVMVREGDLSDEGRADFGLGEDTPHPDPLPQKTREKTPELTLT